MREYRHPWGAASYLFCLMLAAGAASAQVAASDPITFHAQEAARAAAARDWPAAEQHYRAVLQLEPNLAELHSNLGLACYFQQKYSEAEHEFNEALRLKSGLVVPNVFLGRYYVDSGEFKRAVPFLRDAVRLQPKEGQLRRLLAAALVGTGNHLAAVEALRQNVNQEPGDIESLYSLAKIYMNLAQTWAERVNAHPVSGRLYRNLILARRFQLESKWGTARKYYQAARESKDRPRELSISADLGDVALAVGDFAAAIREYSDELQWASTSYRAHFGLAQAYLGLGQLKESLFHFQEAVRTRPEFFQPIPALVPVLAPKLLQERKVELLSFASAAGMAADLATVMLQRSLGENDSDAVSRFEQQRRGIRDAIPKPQYPVDAAALRKAAGALWTANRYESAAEAYERLTLRFPKDPTLFRQLSVALFATGDGLRASAALVKWNQLAPDDAYAQYLLQRCYEDLASETLSQMVKTSPDSYRVHQLTAELLLEEDRSEDAIKEYELALRSRPEDMTLHFGLGQAHFKLRSMPSAIAEFQKVLERNPSNAEASFNVARCYMFLQQPDEAREFAQTAIRLKPDLLAAHVLLGRILIDRGETRSAVAELEKALSTDKDGSLHYQVFLAYRTLKEPAKAQSALEICKRLRARRATELRDEIESGKTELEP